MFCTGTMGELAMVEEVDGRPIGGDGDRPDHRPALGVVRRTRAGGPGDDHERESSA